MNRLGVSCLLLVVLIPRVARSSPRSQVHQTNHRPSAAMRQRRQRTGGGERRREKGERELDPLHRRGRV